MGYVVVEEPGLELVEGFVEGGGLAEGRGEEGLVGVEDGDGGWYGG